MSILTNYNIGIYFLDDNVGLFPKTQIQHINMNTYTHTNVYV